LVGLLFVSELFEIEWFLTKASSLSSTVTKRNTLHIQSNFNESGNCLVDVECPNKH